MASPLRTKRPTFVRADLQASPIDASQLDQIEAAGMKLMRLGGSARFLGKRMRPSSEATTAIDLDWLNKPMVCLRRPLHRSAA